MEQLYLIILININNQYLDLRFPKGDDIKQTQLVPDVAQILQARLANIVLANALPGQLLNA